MTLRLLNIIPSFAGGGAEHQLVKQSLELASRGIDVHIAYLHGGPNLKSVQQSSIVLHQMRVLGSYDPSVILLLCNIFYKIKPTVVQTWLLHSDIFGGIAAQLFGIPWVLSERSSGAMYEHGYKYLIRRHIGLQADAIIANSENGLNYWRNANFSGLGYVIRNIINIDITNKYQLAKKATDEPMVIGVGRFVEGKNWLNLLTALELVMEKDVRVRAMLIGDGPMRNVIESRIAASNVLKGRIDLPGYLYNIADHFRRATVFISLSRYEGCPNVVLEAAAVGCPLILSDIPAHRELFLEEEVCFVSTDEKWSAADAITDVLNNTSSYMQRAKHVRSRLEAFSTENLIRDYIAVYRRISEKCRVVD